MRRRLAWQIWLLLTVGICVNGVVTGFARDTTREPTIATQRWFAGEELSSIERLGFYYLPYSAILFAPFAALPDTVGSTLWRVVSIGTFAAGLFLMARLIPSVRDHDPFLLATLVTIPPMLDAARTGQPTLLMTEVMLLGAVGIAHCRWWLAATSLIAAVMIKPLAIILLLLAGGAYPRQLVWRLGAGLGVMLVLPLMTQQPAYVLPQYESLFAKYASTYAEGGRRALDYGTQADLFSMLYVFGLDVPHLVQTLIRLFVAGLTLLAALAARFRLPATSSSILIFTLAAIYLMLFNPINESNPFAVLAPALGLLAAHALIVDRKPWLSVAIAACSVLIALNFELTRHVTPEHPIWLAPLVTVALAAFVPIWMLRGNHASSATLRSPPGRAATIEEVEA